MSAPHLALYGDPAQVTVMVEALARVLKRGPAGLHTDPEFRASARRLSAMITTVLGDGCEEARPAHPIARRCSAKAAPS